MAYLGDVTKLNHEAVAVIYNSVALGYSEPGNVVVTFDEAWVDQMSHQTGRHVLESYYNPAPPTIQFTLDEVLDLDKWAVAFQLGSKQSDGASGTRFSPTLITAGSTTPFAGQKASSIAQKLILRPISQYVDAATEKSRDMVFAKAWTVTLGAVNYAIETAEALAITMKCLLQPNAAEGEHLWWRGLTAGAWVDA